MFVYGAFLVAATTGLLPNGVFYAETELATVTGTLSVTQAPFSASEGSIIVVETTVAGVSSKTQAAQTLSAAVTAAVDAPRRFIFGIYITAGMVGQLPDGGFVTDGFGLGGTEAEVVYAQAANTILAEGEGGDVDPTGTVAYTQAANTLAADATTGSTGTLSVTQAAHTTTSTGGEVRSILIDADGTIAVGAALDATQADQTLVGQMVTTAVGGGVTAGIAWTQDDQTLVAAITEDITGTLNVTQAGDALTSGLVDVGDRQLVLSFVNGSGRNPSPGVYQYAFFEQATVASLIQPFARGAATVESSGHCMITLPGTALAAGDVGYLVLSNSTGVPEAERVTFNGPVRVS